MLKLTESLIEQASLDWLADLGYTILSGPYIAPDSAFAERKDYGQVVLEDRLLQALYDINAGKSRAAIDEAFRKLLNPGNPSLIQANRIIHRYFVEGITVEYQKEDGSLGIEIVNVFDYENPENNSFVAVNQFTIVENNRERRPDIILFVNGLPLVVIELKNPADEKATVWSAYNQLQTYKNQISSLFIYNTVLMVSDGINARVGTLTSPKEWFLPWKTIDGDIVQEGEMSELEVLLYGIFEKRRFLDLIRYYIVFQEEGGARFTKIMAGYHQYHAVNNAIEQTVKAIGEEGDKRIGVVWHTQGSGKSLTMAFYAGRLAQTAEIGNPTILVLTDRNDLDDQLFSTFSQCRDILRQTPVQAENRRHLRRLLKTTAGGIVFSTIHKFYKSEDERDHPLLSDRENIIVIADEAHRSQYDFIDGFARFIRDALPNASFIGFTGTPIELADKVTRNVFGEYVSIYDIKQAVEDKATVPIYYESRLAMLGLNEVLRGRLDTEFEELTVSEEDEARQRLKTKWAQLEKLVGSEKRLRKIAKDFVDHYEARIDVLEGKAMIVCMSRKICVELYKYIIELRPHWHDPEDDQGQIKVVMTGSADDPASFQEHIRNKSRREALALRFKDSESDFRIVIVRDMWLTGFNAPSLHTMYVDKPMAGHNLMQAIARVNRVFKDKPGGLVVDYIGLADQLRNALKQYTDSGGKGATSLNQEEAVAIMIEKYEICHNMFYGFDMSLWESNDPKDRLSILAPAQEHILAQKDGRSRFNKACIELIKAYALSVPHPEAIKISDDVAFFQAVKAALNKSSSESALKQEEMELIIRQIISKAIITDDVIDIFSAAGLDKPDISILSDEFLAEVRHMEYKNLAVEMLRKLLEGEIKEQSKQNIVLSRSFMEMLEETINKYHNRAIETMQVIEELIELAVELRDSKNRGDALGLNDDEIAFYDALMTNDSAVAVLGDDQLCIIAREIAESIKRNVTIDWSIRENVRAKLRVTVKRILRKYGYPPDKEARATELVLEQAEVICANGL